MLPGHGYCSEHARCASGSTPSTFLRRRSLNFAEEVLDEERDVARALAQRRQADRHDVEAVEEVFAERAGGDELLEVAVGRRDEAHVDADRLDAADALELALLQRAQELDLHLDGDLANLVEEQRAAVGELEAPGLARHRAR